MARKARNGNQQSSNGVHGDGGSSEGDNATGGQPGSGSDGGGNGDGSVITPKLGNSDGDGNDHSDGGAGPGERRRRTYTKRQTGQKTELDLGAVIEFANFGLAQIVNDTWVMDAGECQQFSAAAQKVLRHYDTPAFSAKAMDWVGLGLVVGKIYGPRVAHAAKNSAPRPAKTTQSAGAPGPAPVQRQPRDPVSVQRDGYVTISNPNGDGTLIDVPVAN